MIKKIILACIGVGALVGGFLGFQYLDRIQTYKKIVRELKIGKLDLAQVPDGSYVGSCDALVIGAKTEVTVKDHKITGITLLEHKTERGKPAEVIPDRVLEAQSLQVDTVSGATNSSKVILKSIENAVENRG